MCFAHFGTTSQALDVHAGIGPAARTFAELTEGGLRTVDVTRSDTADAVAARGGGRMPDGYGWILHNRRNRALEPAVSVRPEEEIQLLCHDAVDVGDRARNL